MSQILFTVHWVIILLTILLWIVIFYVMSKVKKLLLLLLFFKVFPIFVFPFFIDLPQSIESDHWQQFFKLCRLWHYSNSCSKNWFRRRAPVISWNFALTDLEDNDETLNQPHSDCVIIQEFFFEKVIVLRGAFQKLHYQGKNILILGCKLYVHETNKCRFSLTLWNRLGVLKYHSN